MLEMERRDATLGEDDRVRAHLDHCRSAHLEGAAVHPGSAGPVTTIADVNYPARKGQGVPVPIIRLGPDVHNNILALSCECSGARRGRVSDDHKCPGCALADQFLEQGGPVTGAAPTDIVSDVDEHHGSTFGGDRLPYGFDRALALPVNTVSQAPGQFLHSARLPSGTGLGDDR